MTWTLRIASGTGLVQRGSDSMKRIFILLAVFLSTLGNGQVLRNVFTTNTTSLANGQYAYQSNNVIIGRYGTNIVSIDTQSWSNASGTWTKPSGAIYTYMFAVGGGGGGGSGGKYASGNNTYGGGGGAGGSVALWTGSSSVLSNSLSVTAGAGGAGGASVSADTTSGNAGVNGGGSHVTFTYASRTFYVLYAHTGLAGSGGTTSAGTAGVNNGGQFAGGAGGAGGTTAGSPSVSAVAASGGGAGGGGVSSGEVEGTGGRPGTYTGFGGINPSPNYNTVTPIRTAGESATNSPSIFGTSWGGHGGGGNSAGNGGAGGNGGFPGGGGGGGAGCRNTTGNSGAGGRAGDGVVAIVTLCVN